MEFDYDSDKLMNIFVFLVPIGDVWFGNLWILYGSACQIMQSPEGI